MKVIYVLVLLFMSLSAHSYQWSGSATVTKFYVSPAIKGTRIVLSNQSAFTESNTSCTNNDWLQLENDTANEGYYDQMYSLLMALYMSGKAVSIRVNGCSLNGYPSIDYISAR